MTGAYKDVAKEHGDLAAATNQLKQIQIDHGIEKTTRNAEHMQRQIEGIAKQTQATPKEVYEFLRGKTSGDRLIAAVRR